MKTPTVQIVYGTPTNQQDTVISDSSGFTELVLWGSLVNAVDVNKSYRIKNVSTRYYKGRRHLTTTKTSTITEIDGIEHVQVPENPYANITTITGSVTEVRVNKTLMCNSCTKKTVSIDETCKFARCPNCGMNQLTKTYTSCISATLNVKSNGADGKKEKLVLFDTVLNNYLVVQQKEGLINDAPRLEEYFLEANALTFEYSEQDNIVHSIRNN